MRNTYRDYKTASRATNTIQRLSGNSGNLSVHGEAAQREVEMDLGQSKRDLGSAYALPREISLWWVFCTSGGRYRENGTEEPIFPVKMVQMRFP